MKNIVIAAYKNVGKTTLAEKIIKETDRNIYGFFTRKFPDLITDDGLVPIYIYPAGSNPIIDKDHLIGYGGKGNHYTNAEIFDDAGVSYITTDDPNGIIIMDELGFLERDAKKFQEKVFECLAGPIPTIVMMKTKMREEFMQKLKDMPDIEYIFMTEENRDAVWAFIKDWLGSL